jgi:hypothetical protein
VLVLHGVSDSKASQVESLRFLARRGILAMAPDFRAHGDSGGRFATYGYLEKNDLTLLRRALMGEKLAEGHRTHLYQIAQRAGVAVRVVAALHWGFAAFHAALALVFLTLPSAAKPFIILPALAVQLAWLGFVMRRMRVARIGWR